LQAGILSKNNMAQKRMFDRAIVDTDKFMDLPMSSKAMYFLLGMEADDEGFVSYKKVIRVHGGNEDDMRVLVAKNFLILFPTGVVVITDWHKNNYMDKNRMKLTEYVDEKSQLLSENGKYSINTDVKRSLNNGSTRVEESSIVESSIEESSSKKLPPRIESDFFNNPLSEHRQNFLNDLVGRGVSKDVAQMEMLKFISYWTELNSTGKKQRWQMEKTFEVGRRLAFWLSKIKTFDSGFKKITPTV
jgi:hypothetical protein